MNRKEKQEARVERYLQYAENAEKRATAAYNASNAAVENIPLGQPILVGHHSEKAHRSALERSCNAMMQSVHESQKADYYRKKAEATENNDNIYLGNDDAIERLTAKIEKLTAFQELMKNANKIISSKKIEEEDKANKLVALGMSEKNAIALLQQPPYSYMRRGFQTYELTNNNAKINAAKKQLEKAKSLAGKEDKEYEAGDLTIEECYSENRVRVYFPDKPDDEMRANLKRNGFRWAPSMGCWQAYINSWTLDFVKGLSDSAN